MTYLRLLPADPEPPDVAPGPLLEPPEILTAELVDLITEHVAMPADPFVRARILAQIVDCAVEAIQWRNGDLGEVEQSSAQQVLRTARDHVDRMHGSVFAG